MICPDGALAVAVDDNSGALGNVVAFAQAAAGKQIRNAALQPRAQLGQWVALYEMERTQFGGGSLGGSDGFDEVQRAGRWRQRGKLLMQTRRQQ